MKTLKEKHIKILEENEVYISSYTDDGRVELEWFTPAGEDFLICAEVQNFADSLYEFYEDFDVDEHVEMLLEAKRHGLGGVPGVSVLVRDAEKIDRFLELLSSAVMAA